MKTAEKQPKKIVKLDELMATMDMDQRHLLEELYDLWSWHPGMG
jgi:hypothetical protein